MLFRSLCLALHHHAHGRWQRLLERLAVLEECERGEDSALAQYRKALKQPLPPAVRVVVERQAQGAQRNHDEVRDLRDRYRSAA